MAKGTGQTGYGKGDRPNKRGKSEKAKWEWASLVQVPSSGAGKVFRKETGRRA
jgi:hypothetical protein